MKRIAGWFTRERNRAYLYRVVTAVGVVLVAKDVITASDFEVYNLLAIAVLGLASVNTSTKEPDRG